MSASDVIARRRAEQARLVLVAREFVAGIARDLRVSAAVVFGSVARGDFGEASDIDLLVVAEALPRDPLRRLAALGPALPARIQVVAWTPPEWRAQRRKENPIAVEAVERGTWLAGSAAMLDAEPVAGRRREALDG